MLQIRIFGGSATMTRVAEGLQRHPGARHVARTGGADPSSALVTAEVHAEVADSILGEVMDLGVPPEDIALARLEVIGPATRQSSPEGIVWTELQRVASANARPIARYLTFMAAAGVIAGFGVIKDNTILTVGAMALSPDLLPVTAACTGLATRRAPLVGRALATLGLGLGLTGVIAAAMTAILDATDLLPQDFNFSSLGSIEGVTSVTVATILVALAAGVAGMVALETRASAAVGVGISITTIPAAAYLGVAAGVGELGKAAGALGVLATNVAMLLVGGTATLLVQRALERRAENSPAAP